MQIRGFAIGVVAGMLLGAVLPALAQNFLIMNGYAVRPGQSIYGVCSDDLGVTPRTDVQPQHATIMLQGVNNVPLQAGTIHCPR